MAKTLSTIALAPAAWAKSQIASMSQISSSGLAGLSMKKTLVLGLTAARQAAMSGASTRLTSMPKRGAQVLRIQRQEPNRARPAIT